jgi:hypothetical protein
MPVIIGKQLQEAYEEQKKYLESLPHVAAITNDPANKEAFERLRQNNLSRPARIKTK